MGYYKCTLRNLLRTAHHDEWHSDFASNNCPVLQNAILDAVEKENYERVARLLKMAEENDYGYPEN